MTLRNSLRKIPRRGTKIVWDETKPDIYIEKERVREVDRWI